MSDVAVITEEKIEQPSHRPHEFTPNSNQLAGSMFGIEQPKKEDAPIITNTPVVEEKKTEELKRENEEEVIDANDWLKREFNWDNEDAAKAEITELRKLKDVKPEYKFENEESRKLADAISKGDRKTVLDILQKQDRIDSFLSSEINNNNAADIIKMNMQLKYPTLNKDQIDFQFNQEYGIPKEPKEPVQKVSETEDEFAERKEEWKERHEEWKERVKGIETRLTISATMAKPELEQAKAKLILPEIQQQPVQKQLTQEELDAIKKYEDSFIQSVDAAIKNFNGISIPVKNEVVDFPVTFGTTDEEKSALSETLKGFAKSNYDTNTLFADLWVNKDGSLNTDQMLKDYHWLKNRDKAIQKIANDSANKAIEAYIKGKKNIDISDTFQNKTIELDKDGKSAEDKIRDSFFG